MCVIFAFIDILWYHNMKLLKATDNIVITTNTESLKATLIIVHVSKDDVGFYICKAVNEVSEDVTKAKLELASSSMATVTKTETKATAQTISTEETAQTVSTESATKLKTGKKMKTVKKIAQKSAKEQSTIEIDETKAIVKREKIHDQIIDKKQQHISNANSVHVVTKTSHTEDADIEIIEETEEIHVKVYKEVYSAEEMENFKVADEVNSILETIQAHQFGSGEQPLRELATVAHLLKKGVEITEIISLYDADFFPALKSPESQSALVQLVERQGYENLIAEILNTESIQDENLLASTVGFRAFMRLVEITRNSVEELITNFKFEDFVSQEWKHKEIKENEFLEVTESRVSSIRAEKITIVGNEFE